MCNNYGINNNTLLIIYSSHLVSSIWGLQIYLLVMVFMNLLLYYHLLYGDVLSSTVDLMVFFIMYIVCVRTVYVCTCVHVCVYVLCVCMCVCVHVRVTVCAYIILYVSYVDYLIGLHAA